jgi:hypothetical protein
MFKKLAALAALALLGATGTQAQTYYCNLSSYNGTCMVQGVLDADGFTVNIGSYVAYGFYSLETLPYVSGQSNDTKIVTQTGALLADDELGHGYDRHVCGVSTFACPSYIKVMPYGAATNQTVRFLVTKLN